MAEALTWAAIYDN